MLAAASLLQHYALINHVSHIMVSHINIQYVYRYYTAAILYGLPELEKYCLEWYQYNLMLNKRNHRMLQEIDVKLMKEIIIYYLRNHKLKWGASFRR